MLILLPPSEGKRHPASGPVLDLPSLSYPGLASTRRRVITALAGLCRTDPEGAAEALGLGPRQREDIRGNTRIRRLPCAPAMEVYSGVLFEALGYASLSGQARARADAQVAICSGLFGLLRPADAIPYYRLSGSTSLPGLGTLASVWKERIGAVLRQEPGLIVDLRSGTYLALGPVPESEAHRAVTVRVLLEKSGRRTIVSHHNKSTKGRLARALLESPTQPQTPDDLVSHLGAHGFPAERGSSRPGRPAAIDVVVSEV